VRRGNPSQSVTVGLRLTFLSTWPISGSVEKTFQDGEEVTLVTLGVYGGELIKASVLKCFFPLLQMRTTTPVARETPVKVEDSDMLMLGEVYRCEREGEDYRVLCGFSEMFRRSDAGRAEDGAAASVWRKSILQSSSTKVRHILPSLSL
jgi:hypothetical protein